jgi:hypothetical protein
MCGLIRAAAAADRDHIGQKTREKFARRRTFEFDYAADGGKRSEDFGAL